MYLGRINNPSDIQKAFGKKPLEMTGDRQGWLLKYRCFYIKIYSKKQLEYEIQYYAWGADFPYKVDIVNANELHRYASYIREQFS